MITPFRRGVKPSSDATCARARPRSERLHAFPSPSPPRTVVNLHVVVALRLRFVIRTVQIRFGRPARRGVTAAVVGQRRFYRISGTAVRPRADDTTPRSRRPLAPCSAPRVERRPVARASSPRSRDTVRRETRAAAPSLRRGRLRS